MLRNNKNWLLTAAVALTVAALPSAAWAGSAQVDGIVDGNDHYDHTYSFSGETEDHHPYSGGELRIAVNGSTLYAAVTFPLSLVDNTWGDYKDSSWGSIGRDWGSVRNSEKWEFVVNDFGGTGKKLEFKVDYGSDSGATNYDAFYERLKYNGVDIIGDASADAASSLGYNYINIDTAPFGNDTHQFNASGWLFKQTYEVCLDLSATGLSGSDLEQAFLDTIDASGDHETRWTFHLSPNKVGQHKTYITPPGTPPAVPLPPTAWMGLALLAGGGAYRRARRRRREIATV